MSDGERAARELVSLLLSSSQDSASAGDPEAARRAFQQLTVGLVRWVGSTACAALQQRALASARPRHPVLTGFHIEESGPRLVGPDEDVGQANPSLFSAIEDVMVELLQLLARLIGPELCARVIDPLVAGTRGPDGASNLQEGSVE